MQSIDNSVSLTDLCAICHVNPLKYTCPRCGIHTCSLPCVKRHKQWAQCSGIRDPAEYRKRSELATPASIDKDFNFITKVERTLQRADDTVVDKGLDLAPARLRPYDSKSRLEQEAESRNIKIIKAPKALSRSKQNKTHWAGDAGCIMWTIEWIPQEGEKHVSHIHETKTMTEAYSSAFGRKKHGIKRKRPCEDAKNEQSESTPLPKRQEHEPGAETQTRGSVPGSPQQHFYIYCPNTEARYRCLIPIPHDASLKETFSNKTFIEFPTVYICSEAPDQLRQPFILESEYIKRHGVDIPINVTSFPENKVVGQDVEDEEEGEIPAIADVTSNLDEAQVLEVLAKDLGG